MTAHELRLPAHRRPASLAIQRREVVALVIGPLLYAALSWTTTVFQVQSTSTLDIRPAVAVPIFFGFVYGPVAGFVTGFAGNTIGDVLAGYIPYTVDTPSGNALLDWLQTWLYNWEIGNGLMGLIPGLAALSYRVYRSLRDQLRALAFSALGVLVGMGFAVFLDPAIDYGEAFVSSYLPVLKVNLLNAAFIVPILLFNYERFDFRSTAWLSSGLMRRLLAAILVSAALPIALLGMFLTQQRTGTPASSEELLSKIAFTVLLSLLFTVANAGMVAQSMSRPLLRLTEAARQMQAGHLSRSQASTLEATEGEDEIGRLSKMFGKMAVEVIDREAALRAEVAQLRIEIDEAKKAHQVEEIVGSDYFKDLQEKARRMRDRRTD